MKSHFKIDDLIQLTDLTLPSENGKITVNGKGHIQKIEKSQKDGFIYYTIKIHRKFICVREDNLSIKRIKK